MAEIQEIKAREILDSRGNPTKLCQSLIKCNQSGHKAHQIYEVIL